MTKRLVTLFAVVALVGAMLAGPAGAQEGPEFRSLCKAPPCTPTSFPGDEFGQGSGDRLIPGTVGKVAKPDFEHFPGDQFEPGPPATFPGDQFGQGSGDRLGQGGEHFPGDQFIKPDRGGKDSEAGGPEVSK